VVVVVNAGEDEVTVALGEVLPDGAGFGTVTVAPLDLVLLGID
jgi:hypothetical protein